jgi:hypothetical protein
MKVTSTGEGALRSRTKSAAMLTTRGAPAGGGAALNTGIWVIDGVVPLPNHCCRQRRIWLTSDS